MRSFGKRLSEFKKKRKESLGKEEWTGCFRAKISHVRRIPKWQRRRKVSAKLFSDIDLLFDTAAVSYNRGLEM